jgi:hypothetical protein
MKIQQHKDNGTCRQPLPSSQPSHTPTLLLHCRRTPGPYTDTSAADDFSPYNFVKNTNNAAIKSVGDSDYLSILLAKGCYGTGSAGCGMYGRLPLNNVKQVCISNQRGHANHSGWLEGCTVLPRLTGPR